MPQPADVIDALRSVIDPDLRRDIVSLGFVEDVAVEDGMASFRIVLTTPACPVREELEAQAKEAALSVPGITQVAVTMDARVRERAVSGEDLIPSVRQCVAVASGKGGVGKSTVTVNLAVALAQAGSRVGLLDADVYGPSAPALLGMEGERPLTREGKLIPLERHGVKAMSIGFLLEEGQAVLWRGPMVAGTVRQLLADVAWGDLDYLLVDLPPGTGDAPMSLAQLVPLTGVALVTTPSPLAAQIAGKAASLFQRLDAPLLGVVENMGSFSCPNCGAASPLFEGFSGEELALSLGAPFLGSVPFDPSSSAGHGAPVVVAAPESAAAQAFQAVAEQLAAQVSVRAAAAGALAPT
jgi:ATP-binding protein involved in chromosome partitioning